MPSPSERVKLAKCATKGRPAEFKNTSPVVKKPRGATSKMWKMILWLAAVLAVAGVGYFIYVAFVALPVAS